MFSINQLIVWFVKIKLKNPQSDLNFITNIFKLLELFKGSIYLSIHTKYAMVFTIYDISDR